MLRMIFKLTVFLILHSKRVITGRCLAAAAAAGGCWHLRAPRRTLGIPSPSADTGAGVYEPELAGFALLLRLLPPEGHLRRHHALPLRDQRALGAHAVPPAAKALVAFQRGHHAVVPAPGALGRARVPPLQRGVARPEEERRRLQKGLRHGHAPQWAGGAKRSDPTVHFRQEEESANALASDVTLMSRDWRVPTAPGNLRQRALRVRLA